MSELAAYAMHETDSRGREYAQEESAMRGLYQRDRERVIHSTAFRRLEYKTQVFVNHEGDLYRTRLTHTMEVAQLSRALARQLKLNEDLAEAVALAHDLGHTPFGHAGEDALSELLVEEGGFNHNLQGLRVVEELERRYPDYPGLNLSFEVREAFCRHFAPMNALVPVRFREVGGALLEVQATVLADEIAYDNHDLDDGLYSGILTLGEVEKLALWQMAIEPLGKRYDDFDPRQRRLEGVRRLINLLISDAGATSLAKLQENKIDSLAAVRQTKAALICLSPELAAGKAALEKFLREKFYGNYRVRRMAEKSKRLVREMFFTYAEDPRQLPTAYQAQIKAGTTPTRASADYIAGMTDRFAQNEYQRLFQPFFQM